MKGILFDMIVKSTNYNCFHTSLYISYARCIMKVTLKDVSSFFYLQSTNSDNFVASPHLFSWYLKGLNWLKNCKMKKTGAEGYSAKTGVLIHCTNISNDGLFQWRQSTDSTSLTETDYFS